jgi:hypothetical protein
MTSPPRWLKAVKRSSSRPELVLDVADPELGGTEQGLPDESRGGGVDARARPGDSKAMTSGGDSLPAWLVEGHRNSVEGPTQDPENPVETPFLRIVRLDVALHGSADDEIAVREMVNPRESRVLEVRRDLLERFRAQLVGPHVPGQRIEEEDSLAVGCPIGSEAEVGELGDLGR